MNNSVAVEKIFQNLTLWRNLPKYQLERRADIFFSLYLKEIMDAKLSTHHNRVQLSPVIIPEFPLRHGNEHHTVNVDYVMFSKSLSTVYLIEFKTDMGSLRDEQFEYLFKAKKQIEEAGGGFEGILTDLCPVFKATGDKQKYFHLFHQLEELGLVSMPSGISDKLYPKCRQGVSSLIDDIKVVKNITSCEIVMLQPTKFTEDNMKKVKSYDLNALHQITFADVVSCLKDIESPFASIFSRYVAAWAPQGDGDISYCAGARTPEAIDKELCALRGQ